MVIVTVMVLGFVVLLIAPTVHRRRAVRSRETVAADREARARKRRDDGAASRSMTDHQLAIRARDSLLLRGVRAELLREGSSTALVFDPVDESTVDDVLSGLSD